MKRDIIIVVVIIIPLIIVGSFVAGLFGSTGSVGSAPQTAQPINTPTTAITADQLYNAYFGSSANQAAADAQYLKKYAYVNGTIQSITKNVNASGEFFSQIAAGAQWVVTPYCSQGDTVCMTFFQNARFQTLPDCNSFVQQNGQLWIAQGETFVCSPSPTMGEFEVMYWADPNQAAQLQVGKTVLAECLIEGLQKSVGGSYNLYLSKCVVIANSLKIVGVSFPTSGQMVVTIRNTGSQRGELSAIGVYNGTLWLAYAFKLNPNSSQALTEIKTGSLNFSLFAYVSGGNRSYTVLDNSKIYLVEIPPSSTVVVTIGFNWKPATTYNIFITTVPKNSDRHFTVTSP